MKYSIIFLLLIGLCGPLSAQCILLQNCPNAMQACDYSNNNTGLWNETYWLDPIHQTQDLADVELEASISVRDTCPGASVSFRYLLFLDLDKNGSWETVIKSWEPPAPGTVRFNNANNPNYDGGELRVFDERPVPADAKYQFALETSVSGDTSRAYLRWNTQAAPNTYVNTELPYATQKIKWLIDDNLGNNSTCESLIVAQDCKKPTVVCINGLSVNIMPTEMITLWAVDFLQYAEDNATPSNQIKLGMRKSGTGTGFPENPDGSPKASVTFTCDELGTQLIELWAKDAAGKTDYCETYVIVQDNLGNCGNGNNPVGTPTVVCKNGLSVSLPPDGQVQFSAADFLNYALDDLTPANLLQFGIRKCGSGTGFPVDGNSDPIQTLDYNCDEVGTQCVELWARDLDGHADHCETYVIIQDNFNYCQGGGTSGTPTVVCLNGLAVNILPTGQITLWTSDFLQYAQDDNTALNQLEFAMRKAGAGTGFPGTGNNQLVFDCTELGTQYVDLWVKDLDGQADYCQTYVIIQDNFGACNNNAPPISITTCVSTACNNTPIQGAIASVNGIGMDPIGPLDINGCSIFPTTVNGGTNFSFTPILESYPANGVTVLDLIKMSKYILGIETDLSPYQLIAADANKSGSVTVFDMVEIRKLILGIYAEFPNNTSWRFVDAGFSFPNPQNPFQSIFPESVTINNIGQGQYQVGFKAIKVGDLDCDAWPGLQAPSQDRALPESSLSLPDEKLAAGETAEISLQLTESGPWSGLQMGLQFDPESVELLEARTEDFKGDDQAWVFQPESGKINLLWINAQAQVLSSGSEMLRLRIRAHKPMKVSEAFKANDQYDNLGSLGDAPRQLTLQFRESERIAQVEDNKISAPQPNPTKEGLQIPVQVSQPGPFRVTLTDLSGRILWSESTDLPVGKQLLQIPSMAFPQAGVYAWRVQTSTVTASGKVVKL